jgi:hypothetical protein
MKRRICLLVLFASVLLILTPQISLAEKKGTNRPLSGSLVGYAQLFADEDSVCWPGPTAITTATGNLSHLGLVAAHFSHCPTGENPGNPITNGHLTLIAANGDQLFGTYADEDSLPPFLIQITGGTGRFKNAEGLFNLNWEITPPSDRPAGFFRPFPWWASIEGKISY